MTKTPDYSDEEELRFAYKTGINGPAMLQENMTGCHNDVIQAMIHTDDIK